jgi:hypothetical protein
MAATSIYSLLNHGVSYKTLQNYSLGQNVINKAAQLVADLERINTNPAPAISRPPITPDTQKAEDTLDDFIAGSIKEIIELRQSLGITTPAGENRPLEDLFKGIKGSVFNETL